MPFAKRAVHLRQYHRHIAVLIQKIEQRNGIEVVTQIAQMRKQKDGTVR